ncbi:hypothetical protein DB88DRAFT_490583 [Papiliotrema laurentii]|uniref:Rrp15p-domain-containing protein n=1 Tax=Papiliotrema laurentii TaxID=5418 RepID=A0AAD9L6D1_PAPLA|nr:hypothetical protein DB88DRAFT_490583 [Papiliotrema laurentii]
MPGNPRSILKKPKGSMSHAMSKNEAGPSTLHRNTKLNAGSKLQKTVQTNRRSADRRQRKQAEEDEDDDDEDEESDGFGGGDEEDVEMSEVDTDEEIARIKSGDGKEKKERKRKRPATTAETFGSTLTALLSEPAKKPKRSDHAAAGAVDADEADKTTTTEKKSKQAKQPAPSSTILSLSHARAPPSRSAENLERKAKRHLQALKEEKEDKARIRDVVEGWAARSVDGGATVVGGQEFEKGLRKTAQRGVIKLFNAILVASKTAEEATTSLSARAGVKDEKPKGKKEKDNIMGRGGKAAPLTQESFLDLVRKG